MLSRMLAGVIVASCFSLGTAHATSFDLEISSTGNNGPVILDFGTVPTGVDATYQGTIGVNFSGSELETTTAPTGNGYSVIDTCQSSVPSGTACSEYVDFNQTTATLPGIYTIDQTIDWTIMNSTTGNVLDPVTFEYSINVGDVSATPLPAALPLFAGGLGLIGLFGWRRKRKAQAVAA